MGQWGAFETLPTALLPCLPPSSPAGAAPSSPSFPKGGSWSAGPIWGLQGAKRAGIWLLPNPPCLCVSLLSMKIQIWDKPTDFHWFFAKSWSNLTKVLPKIPPNSYQNPGWFQTVENHTGTPFYSKPEEQELCFNPKNPRFYLLPWSLGLFLAPHSAPMEKPGYGRLCYVPSPWFDY